MWIAALIAAALATNAGSAWAATQIQNKQSEQYYKNWLRQKYGNQLTDSQLDALYAQYETTSPMINWNTPEPYLNFFLGPLGWGISGLMSINDKRRRGGDGNFDESGVQQLMADIDRAYEEFGYAPEMLTDSQIKEIEENAYNEIDAENRQIMDLYDQTLNRTTEALQQELLENNASFSDYRNQLLTNDVMNQQAIAGSTRYELDRQQRNAIARGASAAQRLVANINTQLGTQAQSAQQALNTSNALAQQLLAHRQAQAGIRQDYTNALNQNTMNRANQLQGQAERRLAYGQGKVGWAMDKNQYARDAWNERIANYFSGNSVGEGIYRSKYGSGRKTNSGL